ncbi:MAG: guanylate kinase [Candidatus Aerophobetes bacterium]|nr:guanylate kinase [Candidatus Aerophobetes bacterium]
MGGIIIVISAPSGVGKTTLCKRLLQSSPPFACSVSFTTRPPRKNEIEGVDYYFVPREEFQKMIKENKFVEWAEVHGQLYGTPEKFLNEVIKDGGKDVLLEVDVKGGVEIKKEYPQQAVLIFLLPPSWKELKNRLSKRGAEDEGKVKKRIERAKEEVKYASYYDYIVINNEINETLKNLLVIIKAEHYRANRMLNKETIGEF